MKQVARMVPFDDILTDDQARRVGESEHALTSLKESIRAIGLLDPPIVEEIGANKVRLRAGRSRYKAIKSLREEGLTEFDSIPCTVLEFDDHELKDDKWKEYKVSQVIFDSNDKRSQLAQIEQARHYQAQMQQFPHLFPDYMALAKFNNKDVSEVKEVIDLLSIDENVMVRIEELNIQRAGTVPGMCIQEIASAAADPKRPLPAEGQMDIVFLLTGSDLKDKRALVLRDKMQSLVREVRRKYIAETRGRKKLIESIEQSISSDEARLDLIDGAMAEPDDATLSDKTFATSDGVLTDEIGNTKPPYDKNMKHGADTKYDSSMTYDANKSCDGATRQEETTHINGETPYAEAQANTLMTAGRGQTTEPGRLTPGNVGVGIIEINLINIVTTLENSKPALDEVAYQRLAGRLEAIRVLLEQLVLQPV